MRHRFVALLLLLVFAGGLFAGPHPCRAQGTPADSVKVSTVSKPSCHGHEAAPAPAPANGPRVAASSQGQDGCCPGTQGSVCEHACHMVALVRVQVSLFAVQPLARLAVPTFDRSLPLFAPPIDHIPLA
jgi:hypothetical protein